MTRFIEKKIRLTHKLTFFTTCLCFAVNATAQVHTPHLSENKWLHRSEEQLLQKHYTLAEQSAIQHLAQPVSVTHIPNISDSDKSLYIINIAALKLHKDGSEERAKKYYNNTSNPASKERVAYALAEYYFENNQFAKAIEYYEKAGIANLNNDEVINAKFELAYSYFNSGRLDEAEPLLAAIKAIDGKYYKPGNYYYGLLAYNRNNYKEALNSFKVIEHDMEYSAVVPYYIAEIHYFTGDKEKALNEAERLIRRSERSYYHKELHLLAAQVYFENKQYKEALPYFEYFYNNTDRIRKEDLYEMAYTYYRLQNWNNAIEYFKQLSNSRDSLGQSSMYLLGDCYLNTGDKMSARNAFSICADMPFNQKQREAALMLAAKLSYELGYNSDAIYYTNLLLADYPASSYTDEAKTLLSDLLIKTRNYADAYKNLQDVRSHTDNYDRVYQKVTYGYALQQMQSGNYAFADKLLTESLKYAKDGTYRTAAIFWKMEAAYKTGQHAAAQKYGQQFIEQGNRKDWVTLLSPVATDRNAYITLGYAAMELSDYQVAQNYFKNAKVNTVATDADFYNTALLREADAVFMQKDYRKAIELYNEVIDANSTEADYALYQKAIILGLQGELNSKEKILSSLIENREQSRYVYNARYELGLTYIEQNQYSKAVNVLQPLTSNPEVAGMAPKSWMKIGFAYQQSGNLQKAEEAYKAIISQYPESEERVLALDALKNIYIQQGQPQLYAQLLKDNNFAAEKENTLDSAYYATAETFYGNGETDKAITAFNEYLSKYPNGVFTVKANYYKAESHYNKKEYDNALTHYRNVLDASWNAFSEKSAWRAAGILYENDEYAEAAVYYERLRSMAIDEERLKAAYYGLLLTSNLQENNSKTIAYADTLLSIPGIDESKENIALLYKANALMAQQRLNEAMDVYIQLETSKTSAIAAEARYNLANILYLQKNYTDAEKAADANIKLSAGNDYWVVKSYILLADIFTQQKDYFNAKATLQSIAKNSKIPELKQLAEEKLQQVLILEKENSKLSEE